MYEISFEKNTNRYTEKDLFDNIEKVWKYHKRQPTLNDMALYPSEINHGTYYNRFGSWKEALKLFSMNKNNGELVIKNKFKRPMDKAIKLNDSIRIKVFKRDNFKCKVCGNSPAIDNNTVIEVDHIRPVSKNGKTTMDNLQTLCRSCNNGKKDANLHENNN